MQLSTLQDLYAHEGPFVTVHVDVSRNTEDAARQLRTRWTTIRQDLEHQGVATALVEEIGERLLDPVSIPGEVRRTIVAAAGEIVFDEAVAGHAPWPEAVVVGDLPDVSGWLRHADGQFPFLLVVADREGADIDYFPSITTARATLHSEVDGESDHLHKIRGGGWKHKRIQQRAENQWESNARDVADEVRSLTTRNRPRVVLLAGDERARVAVRENLDGLPSELVQLPSGGRAAGSSTEALWHDVRMVIARIEAEDQREVSSKLDARWRQGSGAALGVEDVLHALDPAPGREARPGPREGAGDHGRPCPLVGTPPSRAGTRRPNAARRPGACRGRGGHRRHHHGPARGAGQGRRRRSDAALGRLTPGSHQSPASAQAPVGGRRSR